MAKTPIVAKTSAISLGSALKKLWREKVATVRLPNDGLTELNVAEELQYLVAEK